MNVQLAEPDDVTTNTNKPWQKAQQALELIAAFGCQPSPKAYEVFYAHACGNADVRAQVESAAGPQAVLTAFDLDRIHHDNFRTHDGDWERQQRASHRIEAYLGETVKGLASHARLGEQYERTLTEASGRITRNQSPELISEVVDTLIAETGTVRSATSAMRNDLRSTSRDVGQITAELASERRETVRDLLTGLTGRRGFDVQLLAAMDGAVKNGVQLMVCMIGVDGFNRLNETQGRLTGDATLRALGRLIGRYATGQDMVARIGGVTFAILMQGCSTREAYTSASGLCAEIANRVFPLRETGTEISGITVSVGISMLRDKDYADDLMARARARMETARSKGGNAVEAGDLQLL